MFFSQVHQKSSFDDNLHMLRLISMLDGEAERVIAFIDSNGIFYATVLKTLKKLWQQITCSTLKN